MPKPKLLDQIRSVIRFKHFSIRTEDTYIHWIKRFILFHNKRRPLEMSEQEIRQSLSHLAANEYVAASTQNVALSAILFLYRDMLKKELRYINDNEWSNRHTKLPPLFTREELRAILSRLTGANE